MKNYINEYFWVTLICSLVYKYALQKKNHFVLPLIFKLVPCLFLSTQHNSIAIKINTYLLLIADTLMYFDLHGYGAKMFMFIQTLNVFYKTVKLTSLVQKISWYQIAVNWLFIIVSLNMNYYVKGEVELSQEMMQVYGINLTGLIMINLIWFDLNQITVWSILAISDGFLLINLLLPSIPNKNQILDGLYKSKIFDFSAISIYYWHLYALYNSI